MNLFYLKYNLTAVIHLVSRKRTGWRYFSAWCEGWEISPLPLSGAENVPGPLFSIWKKNSLSGMCHTQLQWNPRRRETDPASATTDLCYHYWPLLPPSEAAGSLWLMEGLVLRSIQSAMHNHFQIHQNLTDIEPISKQNWIKTLKMDVPAYICPDHGYVAVYCTQHGSSLVGQGIWGYVFPKLTFLNSAFAWWDTMGWNENPQ